MGSISRQMFVIFLIGISAILLLMGLFMGWQLRQLPDDVHEHYQSLIASRAGEISRQLEGLVYPLQLLAHSGLLGSMDMELIQREFPKFVLPEGYRNLTVAWPDGTAWNSLGEWLNIREQEQYHAIFERGLDLHISQPFFSPFASDDSPIAIVAHSVRRDGRVIGLVNAVIPIDFLSRIAAGIPQRDTGVGWIINSFGAVVAHPTPGAAGTDRVEDWIPDNEVATAVMAGGVGHREYRDSDGTAMIVYFHDIESSPGWVLLASLARSEVFGRLSQVSLALALALLFTLIYSAIFAVYYSKRLSRPIRQLTAVFERAGAGEMTVRADESIPNEVGRAAAEFNRMLTTLERFTYRDQVTGLRNYYGFSQAAPGLLKQTFAEKQWAAVAIISLDDFKRINSFGGYGLGNSVLQHLADRIYGFLREDEMAARHYGDEFILVVTAAGEDEVRRRLRVLFENCDRPIVLQDHNLRLRVSMGSSAPAAAGSLDSLIEQATMAKRRAKEEGGHCLQIYTQAMGAELLLEEKIGRELESVLADGKLHLVYQPIVDAPTGTVVGAESLLRWNHPVYEHIPPHSIIRAAEQNGLIHKLGTWIMKEACSQGASWQSQGLGPLRLSVNVSVLQLENENFASVVDNVLQATGMPPELLVIEITETNVMTDVRRTIQILHRVKELGVKVAIDDFGTGYSSLAYVSQLPMDIVKIDASFVGRLDYDEQARSVVSTMLSLAKVLEVAVTAEGIENFAQAEFLLSQNCGSLQGYFISPPLLPADFQTFLQEYPGLPGAYRKGSQP